MNRVSIPALYAIVTIGLERAYAGESYTQEELVAALQEIQR
jgi:hypothetical protein